MRGAAILAVAVLAGCGAEQTKLYEPDAWASMPALLEHRRTLRAYDGAPPVIPHEVASLGRRDCNGCHLPNAPANGERVGPPRSHPAWGDCRQCHVERHSAALFQSSGLEPLWWPAAGSRLYETAPPTVPHHIQNREDCAVCHIGEQAPAALRAAHGMRDNCRQCHAAMR